jgi:site-specific recombinase XerD
VSKREDGVRPLGAKFGRKWFEIRLTYIDPRTGKKRDTKKKIQADSKFLAAAKRDELLTALRAGKPEPSERKRFGDALDEYLSRPMAHSSKSSRTSYAKGLRAAFGDWWIDAVKRGDLQTYIDKLAYGTSGQSTVRAIMRGTFDLAVRREWIAESPAANLKLRDDSVEKARREALGDAPKRSLTPEEAVLFLADLRDHSPALYPLVATQYVLGCRFSEVSALPPDGVDLETGLVPIRRGQVDGQLGPTKGKYARLAAIPLTLRAELKAYRAMVVEQQWPGHNEFFFPRPPGGWRRHSNAWSIATAADHIRAAYDRLGLSHMKAVTHAARHSMISRAAMDRENEALLRKVVGHSSQRQTAIYTTAHVAQVIELAERTGGALLGKKEPG